MSNSPSQPRRIVNIVNFIRYDEPRDPSLDLLLPVVEQMKLLRQANLPCTWLLQFDALSAGPYVEFLRSHAPTTHEIGLWFELNRMHCDAAGVRFNGQDGINWDHGARASLSVGYSQEERRRLVDTAMTRFKQTFGSHPRTVAAWYIDSFTLAYLAEHYKLSAFAICRDEYGTDGYIIWGGPFSGGYYPSRMNTMVPAQNKPAQISVPVFRMLGPDPIHQYDADLGKGDQWEVISLEPVYPGSGGSRKWVTRFLDLLAYSPTLAFAHAQAGQENSFGWLKMSTGFTMQTEEFVHYRDAGLLTFECIGDTGDWFQKTFPQTPAQSLIALKDTFGETRRSLWYHSQNYRVNILLDGPRILLRDLHVYREKYPETYYEIPCDTHAARFDALPVLDGYGWSSAEVRACGRWTIVDGAGSSVEARLAEDNPTVEDGQSELSLSFPLAEGVTLHLALRTGAMEAWLTGADSATKSLCLKYCWATGSAVSLQTVKEDRLLFDHKGFPYDVGIDGGTAASEPDGFSVSGRPGKILRLDLVA